jgi:DNA-binding CsgD family transcriptional regulator
MHSFCFRTNEIKLSARETQIIAGIILGMTAKQMGEALYLSVRTIEHYFHNIRNKFIGMSRHQIISYVLAEGLPIYDFLHAFTQKMKRGI